MRSGPRHQPASRARFSGVPMNARYWSKAMPLAKRSGVTTPLPRPDPVRRVTRSPREGQVEPDQQERERARSGAHRVQAPPADEERHRLRRARIEGGIPQTRVRRAEVDPGGGGDTGGEPWGDAYR